jgi:uncharacterized phage-associated protein
VTGPNAYSVKELANWILDFAESRGAKLTNMALNKLIFFAYEYSLVTTGRKLTSAKIEGITARFFGRYIQLLRNSAQTKLPIGQAGTIQRQTVSKW